MSASELKASKSASSAAGGASSPAVAPSDYYAMLGIQKDATKSDIDKSYGQLARKWHPLQNLAYQSEAEAMFEKVAEAYAILSDNKMRKQYDASVTDGTRFPVEKFEFADSYDIFDDFKSSHVLKRGDEDDADISSASDDDGDAMSIGSGTYNSGADNTNEEIVTMEYGVSISIVGDKDGDINLSVSKGSSDDASNSSSSKDDGDRDGDRRKDGDDSVNTRTVQLSTETRPDGRTYMTKKMTENGVETLNVVREGDITDDDIKDANRFVEW